MILKKFFGAYFNNFRFRLVILLTALYWLKTIFAYHIDFDLDIINKFQYVISLINPLGITLLLLGFPLFIKNKTLFLYIELLIYLLLNVLLIANVLYFREFHDFITFSTIQASSKISAGLGEAALHLLRMWDFIYVLDSIFLIIFLKKVKHKTQHLDSLDFRKNTIFIVASIVMLFLNFTLAEIDRPQLLKRGFSNNYIVKGLGLGIFLSNDVKETYQINKTRKNAEPSQFEQVKNFVNSQRVEPNTDYFGIAKDRNVFVFHLESFQQFLIDFHLEDENQVKHEVSPFINSLYHHPDTLSFSNIFHQTQAGKSSDSEVLVDTSLFGLNQGAFFVKYGSKNTQNAIPHILEDQKGYTTAAFHGNDGAFWNRNNTYKQYGYQYWFDQKYMSDPTPENSFQYGLNDKILFEDSIQYLERLQQPFYSKFLTATNHYPYQHLEGDEVGFPLAKTNDPTINAFFSTVNYQDSAIKSFFDYFKETGLYDNSIFVLYGDHYGISNSRNPDLAELLGKSKETWSSYDNAMLQRVPYMIHIPGSNKGGIHDTYGGLIDSGPTLLHLLGIDSSTFIQLGQDLLSKEHNQIVTLRTNDHFITPEFTSYAGKLYHTETGEEISQSEGDLTHQIDLARNLSKKRLKISDEIQVNDLLRFHTESLLTTIDPDKIEFTNAFENLLDIERSLGDQSTALFSHFGSSTQTYYYAPSFNELNS
ncbi:LTA synthase family protein [Streptococcus pluranimalium]|uniref:LTA synthase family protein n=1 Tax=Streptococcus pluranimalium TaxID=82348 RepID=UPI0039FD6FF7